MSLIKRMRKQNAVWWRATGVDKFGKKTFAAPVALVAASGTGVRWDDVSEQFMALNGETKVSNARVYCPGPPDIDYEIKEGDMLWLGDIDDVPSVLTTPNKVYVVEKMEKSGNLRATEFLRTAVL